MPKVVSWILNIFLLIRVHVFDRRRINRGSLAEELVDPYLSVVLTQSKGHYGDKGSYQNRRAAYERQLTLISRVFNSEAILSNIDRLRVIGYIYFVIKDADDEADHGHNHGQKL